MSAWGSSWALSWGASWGSVSYVTPDTFAGKRVPRNVAVQSQRLGFTVADEDGARLGVSPAGAARRLGKDTV